MTPLSTEEKLQRLLTFLHDLNNHIVAAKEFAFTNKVSQYKITWCTNAFALRSVMLDNSIIKQEKSFIYKFTESFEDITIKEIANILLRQIDGVRSHLDKITSDLNPQTLDEPLVKYEEVKHVYQEKKSHILNHKFPKPTIDKFEKFVIVECLVCGAKARRYKSGAISYLDAEGKTHSQNVISCIEQPPQKVELEKVLISKPAVNGYIVNGDEVINVNARLKECLVILQICYEDLVKADVSSKGRQMAGRFLYSQGYNELVKHIEK